MTESQYIIELQKLKIDINKISKLMLKNIKAEQIYNAINQNIISIDDINNLNKETYKNIINKINTVNTEPIISQDEEEDNYDFSKSSYFIKMLPGNIRRIVYKNPEGQIEKTYHKSQEEVMDRILFIKATKNPKVYKVNDNEFIVYYKNDNNELQKKVFENEYLARTEQRKLLKELGFTPGIVVANLDQTLKNKILMLDEYKKGKNYKAYLRILRDLDISKFPKEMKQQVSNILETELEFLMNNRNSLEGVNSSSISNIIVIVMNELKKAGTDEKIKKIYGKFVSLETMELRTIISKTKNQFKEYLLNKTEANEDNFLYFLFNGLFVYSRKISKASNSTSLFFTSYLYVNEKDDALDVEEMKELKKYIKDKFYSENPNQFDVLKFLENKYNENKAEPLIKGFFIKNPEKINEVKKILQLSDQVEKRRKLIMIMFGASYGTLDALQKGLLSQIAHLPDEIKKRNERIEQKIKEAESITDPIKKADLLKKIKRPYFSHVENMINKLSNAKEQVLDIADELEETDDIKTAKEKIKKTLENIDSSIFDKGPDSQSLYQSTREYLFDLDETYKMLTNPTSLRIVKKIEEDLKKENKTFLDLLKDPNLDNLIKEKYIKGVSPSIISTIKDNILDSLYHFAYSNKSVDENLNELKKLRDDAYQGLNYLNAIYYELYGKKQRLETITSDRKLDPLKIYPIATDDKNSETIKSKILSFLDNKEKLENNEQELEKNKKIESQAKFKSIKINRDNTKIDEILKNLPLIKTPSEITNELRKLNLKVNKLPDYDNEELSEKNNEIIKEINDKFDELLNKDKISKLKKDEIDEKIQNITKLLDELDLKDKNKSEQTVKKDILRLSNINKVISSKIENDKDFLEKQGFSTNDINKLKNNLSHFKPILINSNTKEEVHKDIKNVLSILSSLEDSLDNIKVTLKKDAENEINKESYSEKDFQLSNIQKMLKALARGETLFGKTLSGKIGVKKSASMRQKAKFLRQKEINKKAQEKRKTENIGTKELEDYLSKLKSRKKDISKKNKQDSTGKLTNILKQVGMKENTAIDIFKTIFND